MVTESQDKNYNDFRVITFLINWIVTMCMCCFVTLYQPFITLWVGKEYTFDLLVVVLFCIYFYLVTMQQVNGMYKDAAGVWHQDRFRPLFSAITNLILNLLLVQFWGIYAILLSTIISYVVVGIPWLISNVFKYVFKRSCKNYTRDLLFYFLFACVITMECYFVCKITSGKKMIFQIVFNAAISLILSNVMMILIYRKSRYYNQMLDLINRVTKYKISWLIGVLKKN